VPSLEQSLPKKYKSQKVVKGRKASGGKEGKERRNGAAKEVRPAEELDVVEFDDEVVEDGEEDGQKDFGATKASLFDDEEEQDEFEGLEEDEEYVFFFGLG
jgi:hypothetical protein